MYGRPLKHKHSNGFKHKLKHKLNHPTPPLERNALAQQSFPWHQIRFSTYKFDRKRYH